MPSIKKIIDVFFATSDTRVFYYIKLMHLCKKNNLPAFGIILSRRLQRRYGVFISYQTEFDDTLILKHPTSIIIGEGVKLGKNVQIFQNVTIGRSDANINAYPTVGDNTIIYCGAVLLGDIKIGSDCIIGANAVVTKDVPNGHLAVGIPARIIER
jgi:Serine acetyltransferase